MMQEEVIVEGIFDISNVQMQDTEIANKYESTPPRIERSIRHAIDISWNRGNWELMEKIFGNSIDIEKAKPTNSEFIITIADMLKLEIKQGFLY